MSTVQEAAVSIDELLYARLEKFGRQQLAGLGKDQLSESTANVTATVSFLVGAIAALAGQQEQDNVDQAAVLQRYVMATFKMTERNAAGVIESNTRLYKKYTYLEKAYNEGYQAAIAWSEDESSPATALCDFLTRHKNVSLANLAEQGIKTESPIAENEPAGEPASLQQPATSVAGRSMRPAVVFWLLAVLMLLAVNFLLFKILL